MRKARPGDPNTIVEYLGIPAEQFTKKDIIRFIEENDVRMLNFRYTAGDGRLKTLNFTIRGTAHLDRLLSRGERVDGSSLFSYVDPASSDIYVVPRYRTAYLNPFSAIPTVDVLCSFYTKDGEPLSIAPESVLARAAEALKRSTGLTMRAMGELEYYVIADSQAVYPMAPQRGYHESSPFVKWESLRCEAMQAITRTGVGVKYGHSEVGSIYEEGRQIEQHEIELSPAPLEQAADQVVIARWVLRMVGKKHGVTVTFAPKIMAGHAGSGLHIHTELLSRGDNVVIGNDGLTDTARKVIAGYLSAAPSLTALGNTVPTSFLRLVPSQAAPTNICWSDRNRSALVRVPLAWLAAGNMARNANPREKGAAPAFGANQTIEIRCPDGSANIHLLLAGLAVAARCGMEMKDAIKLSERLYVTVNIFDGRHEKLKKKLPKLPASCWEAADCLLSNRKTYERDGVVPPDLVDGIAQQLKSYDDSRLRDDLHGNSDKIKELVDKYLHCG
jgi:glutamine synthetase